MGLRHRVGMTDMAELMAGTEVDIARAMTVAAQDGTAALKDDWRNAVEEAGLGPKVANTVRGKTFPAAGESLDPASYAWTKAPTIMDAYDRGPLILPTSAGGHRYLAIPTKNVPMKGRRRMTPLDVEVSFNQDLVIRRSARGNLLAFVDVAAGRFSRSQGAAYGRRKQVRRGKPKLVLMFVLVQWVKVRARISLQAIAGRAQDRYPALLDRRWQAIPDRTARMKGF